MTNGKINVSAKVQALEVQGGDAFREMDGSATGAWTIRAFVRPTEQVADFPNQSHVEPFGFAEVDFDVHFKAGPDEVAEAVRPLLEESDMSEFGNPELDAAARAFSVHAGHDSDDPFDAEESAICELIAAKVEESEASSGVISQLAEEVSELALTDDDEDEE